VFPSLESRRVVADGGERRGRVVLQDGGTEVRACFLQSDRTRSISHGFGGVPGQSAYRNHSVWGDVSCCSDWVRMKQRKMCG